jgi:putative FmdB family regulatory protein
MPTYTYECLCGQTNDVQHSIHEDPKIECNHCGGGMSRKPAVAAVAFRGSGFYSTDKNN